LRETPYDSKTLGPSGREKGQQRERALNEAPNGICNLQEGQEKLRQGESKARRMSLK
jgi:hypothetical protein